MDLLKEQETQKKDPEIEDKELRKITDVYRRMNPANRYFIVSASSMLLASQSVSESEEQKKEVV